MRLRRKESRSVPSSPEFRLRCLLCWRLPSSVRGRRRPDSIGRILRTVRQAERRAGELREQLQEFPAPGPRPQGRGVAGSGRTAVPRTCRRGLKGSWRPVFRAGQSGALSLGRSGIGSAQTNRKFKRRFQWMEARLHESGRSADQASMEELESLWQQAKAEERDKPEKPAERSA